MQVPSSYYSYSITSRSSKDTLDTIDTKYTDLQFVVQEEPTTIVLPVDSSLHSEYCLLFYIRYVHKIGNKVHVIYVSEDFDKEQSSDPKESKPNAKSCCKGGNKSKSDANDESAKKKKNKTTIVKAVGASPGILSELEKEDRDKCAAIRQKVKTYFRTNGVLFEFHRLKSNNIAKAVVQYTKDVRGDMVVIGSRGLGKIKKVILGSVSDKVLQASEVPVVVVKNPTSTSRKPSTVIN